jgi:hypothetical protein
MQAKFECRSSESAWAKEENPISRKKGQVLVAHACNLNYSGDSQEDQCSRPALANSTQEPILKIHNTKKKAGGKVRVNKR